MLKAVDTTQFSLSERGSENNTWRTRDKRLLFAENLVPKKWVPHVLEALPEIRRTENDSHLNIVGDGPYKRKHENLCCQLGLDSCVTCHGMYGKTEIAQNMKKCDFVIMPSQYEGFGVVYAVVMATGKPAIAANTRGPDEVVSSEVGVPVNPANLDELERAIRYMLDDSSSYAQEQIASHARARYSNDKVGQVLNDACCDVARLYASEHN